MKREDVHQGWREKLEFNIIIWLIRGYAVFVIANLGSVVCPTKHFCSTSKLASHSCTNSPDNVYTTIRGEVFDLTQVAATHQREFSALSLRRCSCSMVVQMLPAASRLRYFIYFIYSSTEHRLGCQCSLQRCIRFCQPVQPTTGNTTDPTAQYDGFRAITNDSLPDWYFESMTIMRWNKRVGYMGYIPQEKYPAWRTRGTPSVSTTVSSAF